jgi:hypothetical protein
LLLTLAAIVEYSFRVSSYHKPVERETR